MEDISITLVKNNKYYLKTPFECEVVKLLVESNNELSENQPVAVLKAGDFYFQLESEYPGMINHINVKEGDVLGRWSVLMTVSVKRNYGSFNVAVNSEEHKLLFDFQQHALPQYFYDNKNSFSSIVNEDLVFKLVKDIFDGHDLITPFRIDDLNVVVDNIDGIDLVRVDFPDFKAQLLATRLYFLINDELGKHKCFSCELNLDDELMIFSINDDQGHLTRFNYGNAPDNLDLEKQRIIEIFQ